MKEIARGAESIIYRNGDILIKDRVSKGYRHAEIDSKKRKLCTRGEARLLDRADGLDVNVPKVLEVNEKKGIVKMDFIEGERVKDVLERKDWKKLCFEIGKEVNMLHSGNIVHGDLTTSNMILKDEKIYFIDFGLGFWSDKVEDKAVDIHLFRQALESKHYKIYEGAWAKFLDGYENEDVVERLEKVEKRGRYKRKNSH